MQTFPAGLFCFIAAVIVLLLPQTREKKFSSILFAILLSVAVTGTIFIILDILQIYPDIQFIFWQDWITAYSNAWQISITLMLAVAVIITAAAYYVEKRKKEVVATGILAMLLWGIFALYPILEAGV